MDKTETRPPDLTLRDSAFYAGFLSTEEGTFIRFDAIEAVATLEDGDTAISLHEHEFATPMPKEVVIARIEDYHYWSK